MPWDEWSRKTTIAFGEEPEFRFNLNGFNRIGTWLKGTSPKLIDPRSSGRKLRFLEYSRFDFHRNLENFGVQMLEVDRIYRTCQEGVVQIWRYKAWVGKPVQLPKPTRGTDNSVWPGSHSYSWLDEEGEEQWCSVESSLLDQLVPYVASFQRRLRDTRRSRLLFNDLLYNLQGQAAILRLHDIEGQIRSLDAIRADNPDNSELNAQWEGLVEERAQLTRESADFLAKP